MAIEAVALILEPVVSAVASAVGFLVEIAARIFHASIQPWFYLLSRKSREETNKAFAKQSIFSKVFYLCWGSFALLFSLAVIFVLAWLVTPLLQPKPPTKLDAAIEITRKAKTYIYQNKTD
jgi:hypothetical protein